MPVAPDFIASLLGGLEPSVLRVTLEALESDPSAVLTAVNVAGDLANDVITTLRSLNPPLDDIAKACKIFRDQRVPNDVPVVELRPTHASLGRNFKLAATKLPPELDLSALPDDLRETLDGLVETEPLA